MLKTEYIYSIIIVVLILLIINMYNSYKYEYFTPGVMLRSNYDKRSYKVVNKYQDMQYAADNLAILHEFIINFLRYVKNKFIIKKIGTKRHETFFSRILKNYNPDTIFENDPKPGDETSFVANKGDEFGICLRKKGIDQNQLHELNILKFVMLHELTHLGCISYGHNDEFWSSFKMVLSEAVESKLYIPYDYAIPKNTINYCGLIVKNNPYCDGINNCL